MDIAELPSIVDPFPGEMLRPDQPARHAGRLAMCGRWLLVAVVACQLMGYLCVWFISHVPPSTYVGTDKLVSAGWYDPDSTALIHLTHMRVIGAVLSSSFVLRFALRLGFAMAAAGYVAGLLLTLRHISKITIAGLMLATAVMSLPLLMMPQLFSGDVWSYVFYGRIAVLHGGNPLTDLPSTYHLDPLLARVHWKQIASVYGPAWVIVSIPLTVLAKWLGGSAVVSLSVFKAFLFGCHLVNTLLVGRILQRLRPSKAMFGAMIYAWNPLVLFEVAGNCHNDVFMLTLLLAGIALAAVNCPKWAVGLIVAAGLTKLTGLLGLPVYSIYLARRSARPFVTIATHVAVAIAVTAVLYAPFWHGIQTFHGTATAPNFTILHRSFAALVSNVTERVVTHAPPINQWDGTEPAPGSPTAIIREAVRKTSFGCFILSMVVLTFRRTANLEGVVDRMFWIFSAYILFAALYFNPWYGTWIVPLAAVTHTHWRGIVASSILFLFLYLPLNHFAANTALYLWPWPLALVGLWHVIEICRTHRQEAAGNLWQTAKRMLKGPTPPTGAASDTALDPLPGNVVA